jgi:hypothetical protein
MDGNATWAYDGKSLNMAGYAAKTLSHGLAGGVMAELQGGSFGHGFASAGLGEALSPAVQGLRSVPAEAIATAVVGVRRQSWQAGSSPMEQCTRHY